MYRTGITTTLSAGGNLTGAVTLLYANDLAGFQIQFLADARFTISAYGCSLSGIYSGTENERWPGPIGDPFLLAGVPTATATATTPEGGTGYGDVYDEVFYEDPRPDDSYLRFEAGASGSWSVEVDVEKCFEVTYGVAPWHENVPDAPVVSFFRAFYCYLPGGTRTASISYAGASATSTGTIANAYNEISHVISVNGSGVCSPDLIGAMDEDIPGGPSVQVIGCTTGMGSAGLPSASGADGSLNFDDGILITINKPGGVNGIYDLMPRAGNATRMLAEDKPVSIAGTILTAANTGYPDSLDYSVGGIPGTTSASGVGGFSSSGTQRLWSCIGSVGTISVTQSVNEWGPLSASITSDSLEANGEDPVDPDADPPDHPRLTRLLMQGEEFGGITLEHDAELTLPGSFPTAAASITKTYSPEEPADSYTYLRLSVRSNGGANMAARATIPPCSIGVASNETDVYAGAETASKSWDFQTGADGTFIDIDLPLFAPDNISDNVDAKDGQYPLPARKGAYEGVWRIKDIIAELVGSPGAATIEVESATLLRKGDIAATWLPTFQHSIYNSASPSLTPEWPAPLQLDPDREVAEVGTKSYDYARRFLYCHADGQPVLEEWDFGYTRTYGAGTGLTSYNFNVRSIQALCDAINGSVDQYDDGGTLEGSVRLHPGWSAAPGVPIPDDYEPRFDGDVPICYDHYYNAGLPAVFLAAAGVRGMDGGLGVSAWPLYDSVEGYPGWEGNSANCGAVLRGMVQGLLLVAAAETGSPDRKSAASGSIVTLTQEQDMPVGGTDETGEARGTGTSGGDGWYSTGSPAGRAGNIAHKAAVDSVTESSLPDWFARRRHRIAFLVTQEEISEWLTTDVSDAFRLVRGVVVNGNLRIEAWQGGTDWDGVTSDLEALRPTLRFRHKDAQNTLVCVYEQLADDRILGLLIGDVSGSGTVYRATTIDEGRTWAMATTVFEEGYFPCLAIAPTGLEYHYSLTSEDDDTGALQGKILGGQGQTVVDTFEVLPDTSGIKADMIAAGWRNGTIVLLYRKTSDNSIVTLRSTDGVTFA